MVLESAAVVLVWKLRSYLSGNAESSPPNDGGWMAVESNRIETGAKLSQTLEGDVNYSNWFTERKGKKRRNYVIRWVAKRIHLVVSVSFGG